MPERFGRFVLLEELERGWRGAEYRAAALRGPDLERLVDLLRLDSGLPEGESLLEHLRAASRLAVPQAVAVHEIGRVDGTAFVASDLVEGRSLQAVLARSREEAIPIAPDNAVQIATRVAAALERAHARSSQEGGALVHGLIAPDTVMVSYEGDVNVRGFGWGASGAWKGRLPERQLRYLAPEQREGAADPRSDVFAVGAILLECLTGMHPESALADARLSDGDPLPPPLADVLAKTLSPDPARRLADGHELRRALDALFQSGDVSPTTFNLAYFMYTLFRNAVEHEARVLERERQAIYADPTSPAPSASPPESRPSPPVSPAGHGAPPKPAPATKPSAAAERPAAPRAAARPQPSSGRRGMVLGAAAVVLAVLAAGSYLFLRPPPPPVPTPSPTPGPEEVAALARVRELEARLQAIEEEKAQAEAAAAEAARQKLEAEAARKGRAVDRAAVTRAEEAAAREARAQQEERQIAEKKKIAEEMQTEAARLQAARAAAPPTTTGASPTPAASAMATAVDVAAPAAGLPSPSPGAAASPPATTAAPAAGAGPDAAAPNTSLVYAGDAPGVTPPVLLQGPRLEYPVLAAATRLQGVVVVNAVVDEKGRVTEARAVSPGNEILREAAVAHVLKRRYSPGKKDGAPVKVSIVVSVAFKLGN
jgi:TonB family protein